MYNDEEHCEVQDDWTRSEDLSVDHRLHALRHWLYGQRDGADEHCHALPQCGRHVDQPDHDRVEER